MKTSLIASALAAAILAISGASAATVEMSGAEDRVFRLDNVTGATLSFAVPMTGGYANFGGYVKWSSREDGRKDESGPWGTCLECGYDGGEWDLAYNPWEIRDMRGVVGRGRGDGPTQPGRSGRQPVPETPSSSDLFIYFGGERERVLLWVRPTHGEGSVSLAASAAPDGNAAASMPPVPLPAGGWLLLTALGGVALLRRRMTRRAATA